MRKKKKKIENEDEEEEEEGSFLFEYVLANGNWEHRI